MEMSIHATNKIIEYCGWSFKFNCLDDMFDALIKKQQKLVIELEKDGWKSDKFSFVDVAKFNIDYLRCLKIEVIR